MNDFIDWADFFFREDVVVDAAAKEKFLSKDHSREFALFIDRLQALKEYNVTAIEETFRAMVKELGIEARSLIHPLRVAPTGKTIGPVLFDVIFYLGKQRVEQRLSKFINKERG